MSQISRARWIPTRSQSRVEKYHPRHENYHPRLEKRKLMSWMTRVCWIPPPVSRMGWVQLFWLKLGSSAITVQRTAAQLLQDTISIPHAHSKRTRRCGPILPKAGESTRCEPSTRQGSQRQCHADGPGLGRNSLGTRTPACAHARATRARRRSTQTQAQQKHKHKHKNKHTRTRTQPQTQTHAPPHGIRHGSVHKVVENFEFVVVRPQDFFQQVLGKSVFTQVEGCNTNRNGMARKTVISKR